jgi:hypothetical protein
VRVDRRVEALTAVELSSEDREVLNPPGFTLADASASVVWY